MSGRSKRAFFANCERVALMGTGGGLALWTFTRIWAEDYDVTREAWNSLLTMLRKAFPAFCGVRVYEVHPGKQIRLPKRFEDVSHGLHVHVVTNKFFSWHKLKAICAKSKGWGKPHVQWREKALEAAAYLAKYLTKARPDALTGWRLWASFGRFEKIRRSDIPVESYLSRVWRYLQRVHPCWADLHYYEKVKVVVRAEAAFGNMGAHFDLEGNWLNRPDCHHSRGPLGPGGAKWQFEFEFTAGHLETKPKGRKIDIWANS